MYTDTEYYTIILEKFYQSPSLSSSDAATFAFLELKAAANASARLAGWPGGAPPLLFELVVFVVVGSPRASCNKTLGLSNCDLSTLRKDPKPAPLIDASNASLPASPVCSTGAGVESNVGIPGGGGGGAAEELNVGIPAGGGGGGAAALELKVGIPAGGGGGGTDCCCIGGGGGIDCCICCCIGGGGGTCCCIGGGGTIRWYCCCCIWGEPGWAGGKIGGDCDWCICCEVLEGGGGGAGPLLGGGGAGALPLAGGGGGTLPLAGGGGGTLPLAGGGGGTLFLGGNGRGLLVVGIGDEVVGGAKRGGRFGCGLFNGGGTLWVGNVIGGGKLWTLRFSGIREGDGSDDGTWGADGAGDEYSE